MKNRLGWMVAGLSMICILLTACGVTPAVEAEAPKPVKIEALDNVNEPTRETLTEEAVKRLDLQTAPARDMMIGGTQRTVIPYSAILYDTQGDTWTYINTEPLTYVRHHIVVDRIEADQAILSNGLASGTQVVTVGAEELFGSELEFEEE